jgi:sugar lactone lactonase YvrE
MGRSLETVLDGLAFPEGPRWRDGRLWFSDMHAHEVIAMTPDGKRETVFSHSGPVSGLGWLPDGRMLVVSMVDMALLRIEADGRAVVHGDLSAIATGRCNDMVVDASGRAYVGNFGFDLMSGGDNASGTLLRVDPDGTITPVAEEMWFANGSVITDDGVLLVDETFGNRVSAFDISPDGALANRRNWATFGDLPGARPIADALSSVVVAPDGCALDAEGALWIADGLNGRAIRVREGGEIVDEVSPGTGVFACGLGGPDGRTLYLCAAPDFDERARSAAREAQLLSTQVQTPHAGLP